MHNKLNNFSDALLKIRDQYINSSDYAEVVYWTIRDAIRTGLFLPGTRISEAEITSILDISSTPVREAFNRLHLEHLIEKVSNRGGYVIPQVTVDELITIYEITEVLFGLAARRAAQYMGYAEIELLADLMGQMEITGKSDELETLSAISRQFHDLIISGARNSRLKEVIELLNDTHFRTEIYEYNDPERVKLAIREHKEIFQAIAAHDPNAENIARNHNKNAMMAQIRARHLTR